MTTIPGAVFYPHTIRLPSGDLKLAPRLLGTAQSSPDPALGHQVAVAFANLKGGNAQPPSPPPEPLDPASIPQNLMPKTLDLSAAQRANLAKLRWGLTKDLHYRGDGENATVRWLSATALAAPLDPANPGAEGSEALAQRFIAENQDLFLLRSANNELVFQGKESDGLGGEVVRLQQSYQGLEVWPARLTANVNRAGYLTVVTGAYVPTPDSVKVSPQITPETALASAGSHMGAVSIAEIEVHSGPALKIYTEKGKAPALSYEIVAAFKGDHERIFVDAENGNVLAAISEICHGATTGSGTDVLGATRQLNVYSDGSPVRYRLIDTTKSMFQPATGHGVILIVDASNSAAPNFVTSNSATSGWDREGVSAAYNLGKIYDFFYDTPRLERNSYDGKGATITARVRVPEPGTGGVMSNAYWNFQLKEMGFGLGDRFTASSDVVAHEFTHAVIDSSVGLIYRNESGAINESMSDILGECFEYFLTGANDWRIGSQLTTGDVGGAFRSMSNPALGGQPATMKDFRQTTEDNGGVHINSGIPNRAFYLLAVGLSGDGIGIAQARDVFYRALITKLNSGSDFHDLRTACVQSATELYGAGSTQATKTGQAFDDVLIFDRTALPPSSDLTPPAGPDSYLISYETVDGNYYLGRRETAFGETGSSVTAISNYAMDQDSRPTVTADGKLVAHVTAAGNIALSSTDLLHSNHLSVNGLANAISISADGKYSAFILKNEKNRLPEPILYYLNLENGNMEQISLYLPVADGPDTIRITSVDEVDLSLDGQYALFDGVAEAKQPDGMTVKGWTIFAVDLKTKQVFALLPPSPTASYGNPSFARTSNQRFVFEVRSDSSSNILAVDLGKGTRLVREYTPPEYNFAYPRYSSADDFIVYTDDFFSFSRFSIQPRLSRVSLLSDHVTPTGSPVTIHELAVNGLSYRRGAFAGAPEIAVQPLSASIAGGSSGRFRISRISGDQAIPVSVSFKTTGTAIPDVDYLRLTPFATMPAGQNYVDVNVSALLAPGASSKSLTLSIDPRFSYVVSESAPSASMSLLAPSLTYAYYASEQGIGAAGADDDGDAIPNLIEYALGSNPKAATSPYPVSIRKATDGLHDYAQLQLARNLVRDGITFTLQSSPDNSLWSAAGTAVVTDDATLLVLRDSLAVQPGQFRSFRILVTETGSNTSVPTSTCYWAGITLGNLAQTYDGQPKTVSVTTNPSGFQRTVTYNGTPIAPVNAGSYVVAVRAASYTNLIGENGGKLNIAKAPQTTSFAALPDKLYTTVPLNLTASATSGRPVKFSVVSGNAVMSGTSLILTGVGRVTVRAEQAGDANYLSAPIVDRSFSVLENYDWWRETQFSAAEKANPSVSGPEAAVLEDGVKNLLKYALGLNAEHALSDQWFRVHSTGNTWSFLFLRPVDRTDLVYTVEVSSDLKTWTSDDVLLQPSGTAENGMQIWRVSAPKPFGGKLFYRLHVTFKP